MLFVGAMQVKMWITFNEPPIVTLTGYGEGGFAPGVKGMNASQQYVAGKNLILAHAKAYHVYKDEFNSTQNGSHSAGFGVCLLCHPVACPAQRLLGCLTRFALTAKCCLVLCTEKKLASLLCTAKRMPYCFAQQYVALLLCPTKCYVKLCLAKCRITF